MKVGVTLPQFRSDPEPALAVAAAVEDAGLDGIFVFDHLWPLGNPERPMLHSTELLGAVAAETSRVTLGTLVARVGLVADAMLVHALVTLAQISGGRLVAGLGTGDEANRAENEAYGVDFQPLEVRREHLLGCSRSLSAEGVPVWVGGRSQGARRLAVEAGAAAWNGWGIGAAEFTASASELAGSGVEATWAGQVLVGRTRARAEETLADHGSRPGLVRGSVEGLRSHLDILDAAGATWAVLAPLDIGRDPEVVDLLAAASRAR